MPAGQRSIAIGIEEGHFSPDFVPIHGQTRDGRRFSRASLGRGGDQDFRNRVCHLTSTAASFGATGRHTQAGGSSPCNSPIWAIKPKIILFAKLRPPTICKKRFRFQPKFG